MPDETKSPARVTIAIVCGYDLDSDLGSYIERVARRLHGVALDGIVLSGGRTSPHVETSEAREMSRHLAELLPHGRVLLDHEAMNTLDNLVFARQLASGSLGSIDHYIVCCDIAHSVKARILAWIVLPGRSQVVAVPRDVPLHIWLREPLSIFIETLGAIVAPLRPLLSHLAARMKGVTEAQRRAVRATAAS